jgi:predicted Zn-dependent protease with MMP-like domain
MNLDIEQFEILVGDTLDKLPQELLDKVNNIAILVDDEPTEEQLEGLGRNGGDGLFGLFEGHCQSKKLNIGAVLPDRITLFRKAMIRYCNTKEELQDKIEKTINHEIAHHFGSDEVGAKRAESKK